MTITEERGLANIEGEFSIVRPLATVQEALQNFHDYQALTRALLQPSDMQTFREGGKDGKFVKKSGWRRIATPYGITVEMVDERLGHGHEERTCSRIKFPAIFNKDDRDCGCQVVFARYIVKAVAPNGRKFDGMGICSLGEKNRKFTRQDHDIATTAYTRAVNRAISDMIGAGEISAEEIRGSAAVNGLAREDKDAIADAWRKANTAQRDKAIAWMRDEGFQGTTNRDLFSDFNLRAADDQVAGILSVLGSDEIPFDPEAVESEPAAQR